MNNKFLSLTLLTLSLLLYQANVYSQTNSAGLSNQKVKQYQEKWLKYLKALGQTEGSIMFHYNCTNNDPNQPTVSGNSYNELYYNYPLIIDATGYEKGELLYVNGSNRNYTFQIKRPKNSADTDKTNNDQWIINEVVQKSNPRTIRDIRFPVFLENGENPDIDDGYSHNDSENYTIFNTLGIGLHTIHSVLNLNFLFSSPYMNIQKFTESKVNGTDVTTIEFVYKLPELPDYIKEYKDRIQSADEWVPYELVGKITLVTDYHLISEASFFRHYGNVITRKTVHIEYQNDQRNIPLPVKSVVDTIYEYTDEPPETGREEAEYCLRPYNSTNDPSLFTLSHYGLPEPEFLKAHTFSVSFTLRLILLFVGIILVCIGLKFIYQKHIKKT